MASGESRMANSYRWVYIAIGPFFYALFATCHSRLAARRPLLAA